jgi:hypothetical protein
MSNLTPIKNTPPGSTTTEPLSRALKQLLECERSADEATAAVLDDAQLLAETKAALPALWRRVDPAGDGAVQRVIASRFPIYPQPNRSAEEWVAWWGSYYRVLSDQPAHALEAGMCEWEKTDTTGFMPKPGQLLALVKTAAEPHWRALSRANRLAKLEPPKPATPESLEARRAMAENVRNLFQPKEADHGR